MAPPSRLFLRSAAHQVVPNAVVSHVPSPAAHLMAFSPRGDLLLGVEHGRAAAVAYRLRGPTASSGGCRAGCFERDAAQGQAGAEHGGSPGAASKAHAQGAGGGAEAPVRPALSFEGFFEDAWRCPLAAPGERLCRNFLVPCGAEGKLALFATASPPREAAMAPGAPAPHALARTVPVLERCALHLVRLSDGKRLDTARFDGDYLVLQQNACASLADDVLVVMAVRSQTLHVFHIQEGEGRLLKARVIGPWMHADDRLVQAAAHEAEAAWHAARKRGQWLSPSMPSAAANGAARAGACEQAPSPCVGSFSASTVGGRSAGSSFTHIGSGGPRPGLSRAVSALSGASSVGRGGGEAPMATGSGFAGAYAVAGGAPAQQAPAADYVAAASGADDTGDSFAGGGTMLDGLHQRVLSYLYRKAAGSSAVQVGAKRPRDETSLDTFYCHFGDFERLAVQRAQLLDGQHLLLRLGSPDSLTARGALSPLDAAQVHSGGVFLVVLDIESTRVVDVRQGTDEALQTLLERYADHFRGHAPRYARHAASVSNCEHLRTALRRTRRAIGAQGGAAGMARGGGAFGGIASPVGGGGGSSLIGSSSRLVASAVVLRALGTLPAAAPAAAPSPYLDAALFRYDERLVLSPMDRPRAGSEHSVRFQLRADARAVAFRVGAGGDGGGIVGGGDRGWSATAPMQPARCSALLGYLFHPFLPFIISIQHSASGSSELNFHFRWE